MERRALLYRGDAPRQDLTGRIAIVVDDGIATGSTARAACQVARAHGAARVVLAAPVAPPETRWRMASEADELIVVASPEPFSAVGQFYRDFRPTSDADVVQLLARARQGAASTDDGPHDAVPAHHEVEIPVGDVSVVGDLQVPADVVGTVVFAHGSGSSRHSPRNREVATVLNRAGIATLLFDLLTPAEELNRANVFDIDLLAERLVDATRWVQARPELAGLPIGYFGASTGAAAALWAAARADVDVAAVVSRGGRPDLATPRLEDVRAPTLLVVGGADDVVLGLNRLAAGRLRCRHELVVVPGATHLFQEPGTLARAAEAARDWFRAELTAAGSARRSDPGGRG